METTTMTLEARRAGLNFLRALDSTAHWAELLGKGSQQYREARAIVDNLRQEVVQEYRKERKGNAEV